MHEKQGGLASAEAGEERAVATVFDRAPSERDKPLAILFRLTDRLYHADGLGEIFDAALEAISAAFGCDRASMLLFDEDGVMRFVAWRGISDGYRKAVDGHTPWKPGQRDAEPIFVEDIELSGESESIKAAVRGEGIRALAFIPLVARGETVGKFMTYHAEPRVFSADERELAEHIALRVAFGLERARAEEARQRAEAALRESEDRFRLMSEDAPVMIWVSRPDGSCLYVNRMLREFWAIDEENAAGFDWRDTIHPDDAGRVTNAVIAAIQGRRSITLDARYRSAEDEYRVLTTRAQPRFADDGTFLGMIGINLDTTERREAEAQRELLLTELNHRVKNTLAVVQGIARQTLRDADSVESARASFEGRLMALSNAHDLLIRTNWTSASLGDLARDVLPTFEDRPQISVSGPHVVLGPRQTLGLTLALHELFTNAMKYGALTSDTGHVTLAWSLGGPPGRRLKIEWRETGGPAARAPEREGFGTRLIRQIFSRDLEGEISMEFSDQGLTCTADMPLH